MQIHVKQKIEAMYIATLIQSIEKLHNETNLNVVDFLTPIFTLPEYSCFQHVAENSDDWYVITSYRTFLRLIDVLDIEEED